MRLHASIVAATVAGTLLAAPAAAVGVDLSGLTGGLQGSPSLTLGGVTFSNPSAVAGADLRVTNLVGGLVGGGICADDPPFGLLTNSCDGTLRLEFLAPVNGLRFRRQDIALFPTTTLEIETEGGTIISGTTGALVGLNLLDLIGSQFDLSAVANIRRLDIAASGLLTSGPFFGEFVFEPADAPETVPLPAPVWMLLSGLAGMAAMRLRRRRPETSV